MTDDNRKPEPIAHLLEVITAGEIELDELRSLAGHMIVAVATAALDETDSANIAPARVWERALREAASDAIGCAWDILDPPSLSAAGDR